MRRREFVAVFGSAIAALPGRSFAQATAPEVGFIHVGSPGPFAFIVAAFRKGLSETGFIEHDNLKIEYRWAEDHYERLPELFSDLLHRRVAVLAAFGGLPAALVAKKATSTVPVILLMGGDPVQAGVVASLNQLGGNRHHFLDRGVGGEAAWIAARTSSERENNGRLD